MLKYKAIVLFYLVFACNVVLQAKVLHVGYSQNYPNLMDAVPHIEPGDTVMIHQGIYAGGLAITELKGTDGKWIVFTAAPNEEVIFQGGSNSWQMIDVAYIHIRKLIFQQQTGNGFNIDDGGDYSTPTHHIIFEECIFRDMNATGNNDLLKMSGIDDFEIRECIFLNGSQGGSGIDMVGCHNGKISNCYFENMGSNSIQAKGGCRDIRIERNFFKNGGQRSLNLGGSTGLQFFRPLDAKYEAAYLKVYANVFIGSVAPIAFVGCIETEVVNNTIYLPQKWVLRILQETVDTSRFYACSNNTFRNNLIYKDNQVSVDCNIGPNTLPETFLFSNNLWYHAQNQNWTGPSTLPVPELHSLINVNPMLIDPDDENFSLLPGSPAIGKGFSLDTLTLDFIGNTFNDPPSIGAFEGNPLTVSILEKETGLWDISIFPNPVKTHLNITIRTTSEKFMIELIDLQGRLMQRISGINGLNSIDLSSYHSGPYIICIKPEGSGEKRSFLIIKE